jgi:hypothetical protein
MCFRCTSKVEDECHFLVECPVYAKQRAALCDEIAKQFCFSGDSRTVAIAILNPTYDIAHAIGRFVYCALEERTKCRNETLVALNIEVLINWWVIYLSVLSIQ